MNSYVSICVLVAICCCQTFAQTGNQGIGFGQGGSGQTGQGADPWSQYDVWSGSPVTEPPPSTPPTASAPYNPFDMYETTPQPQPTTPSPIVNSQNPGGSFGGPVTGGIRNASVITQVHRDMAGFAAQELGSEYSLDSLRTVREQVVAGMNYYMEVFVNKTSFTGVTRYLCEVKVYHVVWLSKKSLEEFHCKKSSTPING